MIEVANIAALKAQSSTVGTLVQVNGYFNAGDGGGGIFKAIPLEDFISGANVSASGSAAARTFSTINWKYGVERQQPLLGHYADQIKWTGGATWTNNHAWMGPDAIDSEARTFFGDASFGVANGEKGYLVPKVEGFRVIPTYGGWDKSFIWERVVENGEMTPEMFGGMASKSLGDNSSGVDCTAPIQALLDSPFAPKFGGGSYYISGKLFLKLKKNISGVGARNMTLAFNYSREPIQQTDKHSSTIWTDQNIDILSIQQTCHIEKLHFDVSKTSNGVYDKTILNYDMSFGLWGCSVEHCTFYGNQTTTSQYTGKGGIAIRFNSDDSDSSFSRRNNGPNTQGFMTDFRSHKLGILGFARGVKVDQLKASFTSPVTGLVAQSTWCNCCWFDATFIDCKIGAEILLGSVHKLTGEYFQDGLCLPYSERDFPCFRLYCGIIVDIGIGDQRHTQPQVNDDISLGGTVTYPQAHWTANSYDIGSGVTLTGRSLRDYDKARLGGNPAYAINNNPIVMLDNYRGHLNWDRGLSNNFSFVSSWIDNGLLFADRKGTMTVNALRSTVGYNFASASNELVNIFPKATGVTVTNFNKLADVLGLELPTIAFGSGSDVDLDFVEVVFKNPATSQNFINRATELLTTLVIGCKRLQVMTVLDSGTIQTSYLVDTSQYSNIREPFRFPLVNAFGVAKLIIRFIGSTGVNTQIEQLHTNSVFLTEYPFLPTGGGQLRGPLTFAPNTGLAPLPKRATLNLSSANILSGFSDGVRQIASGQWLNVRAVECRVTSGTLNYATNTMLDFFHGTKLCPLFSIDLAKLVRAGNRRMIPLNPENEQFANSGLACQVRNGNPTGGNKAISVVIDYTDV